MAIVEQNSGITNVARETKGYCVTSARSEISRQGDLEQAIQSQDALDNVQYDVTERTSQIAAWWQEMARQEEEMEAEVQKGEAKKEVLLQKKDTNAFGETDESVRSLERMLERMREQQKNAKNNQNKVKKVLAYNYKKVSAAIGGAKTLIQATSALTSANSNLTSLRRKAASGKYEEEDIAIAKSHAMKMVRAARKKVRNIKLEANKEKQNMMTETEKRQDRNAATTQKQHHELEEQLQRLKKELEREEKQYKNRHRRKEDWDLMQADMEYLRRKIDLMRSQENKVEASISVQQTVEGMAAVPEASGVMAAENEQEIQTQQEAAMAVAEVSMGTAPAGVDITI